MSRPRQAAPRLTGGIGNRLFQIVATLKFCEETKRQPILLLPMMSRSEHGSFNLVLKLFPNLHLQESADRWKMINDRLEDTKDELVVLNGFFQNLNYFPSLTNPLLPKLPLPQNYCPQPYVAIHFRFGDYRTLPHHQLPLGYYYANAINKFPKSTSFVLFSDSPEKLKEISHELWENGYSNSICKESDPLKTFQLIAQAKGGFIGSNSTFAWWAAYFAWDSLALERSDTYKAYFPDIWMPNVTSPNLFTMPFTISLTLSEDLGSAFRIIKSFSYL